MNELALEPIVDRLDRIARLLEKAVAGVMEQSARSALPPTLGSSAHEPLWNARQTAEFLHCSVSKVYKAAEANTLPCLRDGRSLRFKPSEIRNYVERLRARPSSVVPLR